MAHVQTVLGPIEPDALGFTLPHEHTQIALWHIESRWDYWQLTRDEPVILAELAQFRAAGGSGLVDLTPTGRRARSRLARRSGHGERPPHRHGLWLVPHGLLPARGPDRPALDRRPRRRAGSRGDRRGGGVGRPARDHRRDRDRQAVGLAVRGACPSGGCPCVAADRAGHHDPRRAVRCRARPAPDLRGGGRGPGAGRHRPRRLVPGPRPLPGDHRTRREPRIRLHRDALGTRTASGRRASSSWCASSSAVGTEIACSSARTSAATRSSRPSAATATPT